jgi:hypothetical protein
VTNVVGVVVIGVIVVGVVVIGVIVVGVVVVGVIVVGVDVVARVALCSLQLVRGDGKSKKKGCEYSAEPKRRCNQLSRDYVSWLRSRYDIRGCTKSATIYGLGGAGFVVAPDPNPI